MKNLLLLFVLLSSQVMGHDTAYNDSLDNVSVLGIDNIQSSGNITAIGGLLVAGGALLIIRGIDDGTLDGISSIMLGSAIAIGGIVLVVVGIMTNDNEKRIRKKFGVVSDRKHHVLQYLNIESTTPN